jgi:hypothetical protein
MRCVPTLVNYRLRILELRSIALYHIDAASVPTDAKVNLLHLPVLQEDCAPNTGHDSVGHGVIRKPLPSNHTSDGRKGEKHEVILDEGEIKRYLPMGSVATNFSCLALKTYLAAMKISDPVKIGH